MHQTSFEYGQGVLDIGKVLALAEGSIQGSLTPAVIQKIRSSEKKVADIVGHSASVYGINTGFGILASADFTNWTNIGYGFTGTNGQLIFQDTNFQSFPARFYRAYWPLP